MRHEALELRRDPISLTLAVLGSLVLMIVVGYGINLDVDNLSFAVLDFDQTTTSENYVLNIAGSRYFVQQPPITDYADLQRSTNFSSRRGTATIRTSKVSLRWYPGSYRSCSC
jgi:ribosome-dependent ATPase